MSFPSGYQLYSGEELNAGVQPQVTSIVTTSAVTVIPVQYDVVDVLVTRNSSFVMPPGVDGQLITLRISANSNVAGWTFTPPANLVSTTSNPLSSPYQPEGPLPVFDLLQAIYCAPVKIWVPTSVSIGVGNG